MTFDFAYFTQADTIPGHLYTQEATLLWQLADLTPKGGTMVEIGCDLGRSTTLLANIARMKETKLIVVDCFVMSYSSADIFLANMDKFGLRDVIELWEMTSEQAAKKFRKKVDFLFLDADHSEPGIRLDMELWPPKIRQNGIMVWHDYKSPVFPAITELVDAQTADWEELGQAPLTIGKRKP